MAEMGWQKNALRHITRIYVATVNNEIICNPLYTEVCDGGISS